MLKNIAYLMWQTKHPKCIHLYYSLLRLILLKFSYL